MSPINIWLIAIAYLVGGVPFAFLLVRRVCRTDVRFSGSGNIGASNVLRTTGPSAALVVLALDMGKGYAVVLFSQGLGVNQVVQGAVAAAVVLGHVYPIWLRFHGGKGVASGCGAFAALAPSATFVAAVVFVVVVWFTRYVSLGSIAAALLLAPLTYVTASSPSVVVSALGVGVLVLVRHRANARRLYTGSEHRLGGAV